jgi:hypothetical protein
MPLAALMGAAYLTAMAKHPISDHFDGTRFFVPGHDGDKTRKELLKMLFGGKRAKWPTLFASTFHHTPPERVEGIRSTLIGHASFLLQIANTNILIDPVFSERASPVSFAGSKRVNAPGIAFDDLPPIDAVLLTIWRVGGNKLKNL